MRYYANQISELKDENLNEMVYSLIYKYFDTEISSKELCATLWKEDIILMDDFRAIKACFIENFQDYAKEKHGIEDLEKHVYEMKFLKRCFELYSGLKKGTIKPGEYGAGIEKLGLDMNRFTPVIKDYCAHNNIKLDPLIKILPVAKLFDAILREKQKSVIREFVNEYARYEEKGSTYAKGKLHALSPKMSSYAKYRFGSDPSKQAQAIRLLNQRIDYVMNENTKVAQMDRQEAVANKKALKDMEMVKEKSSIIIDYINSKQLLVMYLRKKGLRKDRFMTIVNAVEKYNPELYEEYKNHYDNEKTIHQSYNNETVKRIVDYIINGIYEDGEVRPYNLLDYYQETDITCAEFISLASAMEYPIPVLNKVKNFMGLKYTINDDFKVDDADEIMRMDIKLEEAGVEVKIPDEVKQGLIRYLKSIGVTKITVKLFNQAYVKYKQGKIIIDEKVMVKE